MKPKQHRLYRETQDDYWEGRARRARRKLAFRCLLRVGLVVVIAAAIIAAAGYFAHRADPRLASPSSSVSTVGGDVSLSAPAVPAPKHII